MVKFKISYMDRIVSFDKPAHTTIEKIAGEVTKKFPLSKEKFFLVVQDPPQVLENNQTLAQTFLAEGTIIYVVKSDEKPTLASLLPPPVSSLPTSPSTLPAAPSSPSTQKHVMISYNWDHQHIIKKIKYSLQEQGYKVWLDLEKMHGDIVDAMADAVDNSAVILVCMSNAYSNSVSCQREGKYALQQKKDLIPLMMEDNFAPTGWLGLLLGTRLYIKFTSEDDWDTKMSHLVREIGTRGKL